MLRSPYFGILLGFAATVVVPAAGQTSLQIPVQSISAPAKSAPGRSRVEHVGLRGTGSAAEVEIQISGAAVAPNTQVVSDPDRIIIDFPGALPGAELHALEMKVNSGSLKSIRAGLFFNNPPITRVVLDLSEASSYHIATEQNAIIVKLGPAKADSAKAVAATSGAQNASSAKNTSATLTPATPNAATPSLPRAATAAAFQPASRNASAFSLPHLQTAMLGTGAKVMAKVQPDPVPVPVVAVPPPAPKPLVKVTFSEGMLSIHSEKATLAQVLYEVANETDAEIAIPAGAEQEEVISDLGPAPAREVLASLLNGSPYNFIFVGNESTLERVILTRRDPNIF
jgi:AMIN domain